MRVPPVQAPGRPGAKAEELTILINERKVGPLEGFRTKAGRPFSALVVLDPENQPQVTFEVDKGTHIPVGPCPVCRAGQVFDVGSVYVCENVPKGSCTFQMSKLFLKREILPEQMQKLLKEGKTDLLRGFITKKGKTFDSVLTLANGKIDWEFASREPRIRKNK